MFGKFICVNFMNTGTCHKGAACSLKHVNDITSLESSRGPAAATGKSDGSWIDVGTAKKKGKTTAAAAGVSKEEKKSAVTFASEASSSDFSVAKVRAGAASKKEEREKALKKSQPCKFLLTKGTCRMGERCHFSHEGISAVSAPVIVSEMPKMAASARGGMRPRRERKDFTDTSAEAAVLGGTYTRTRPDFSSRGPRVGQSSHLNNATSDFVKLIKHDDGAEYEDIMDFKTHLRKIYADLVRLEPVRRALFAGKELDMMFIIDCTGSMGTWIEACKREIKAIIDCVRNQHFNIQIRVSVVAYRDHCDGNKIEEVFKFSDNIAACQKFISQLQATGGGDGPEDVAGGFENALKQNWAAKNKYCVFLADAPAHGKQYHND